MTNLSYNFNGGTNGNSIATSDTGSGDPLDVVSIGTGTTVQWDNTHPNIPPLGGKFASTATSTTGYIAWTSSVGSLTRLFGRAYYYQTGTPTVSQVIMRGLGAATQKCRVYVNTSGKLVIGDTTNGTLSTSTASVASNQQVRVEWNIQSGTSATYEVRYYATASSDTITETLSGSAANFTATNFDEVRFGIGANFANAGPYWLDEININDIGFPGPVQQWTEDPISNMWIPQQYFWVPAFISRSSLADVVVATTNPVQPIVVAPIQQQASRFAPQIVRSSIQDFATPVTVQPLVVAIQSGPIYPIRPSITRAPDPSQYLATPVTQSPIVSNCVALAVIPQVPVLMRNTLQDPVIVTSATPQAIVVSPIVLPVIPAIPSLTRAPDPSQFLVYAATPSPMVVTQPAYPIIPVPPSLTRAPDPSQYLATPVTPMPIVVTTVTVPTFPYRVNLTAFSAPGNSTPSPLVVVPPNASTWVTPPSLTRAPDPSQYLASPVTPMPIVVGTVTQYTYQRAIIIRGSPIDLSTPQPIVVSPIQQAQVPNPTFISRSSIQDFATPSPMVVTSVTVVAHPVRPVLLRASLQDFATPVTPMPIVVSTTYSAFPVPPILLRTIPQFFSTPVNPQPIVVTPPYVQGEVRRPVILRSSLQNYSTALTTQIMIVGWQPPIQRIVKPSMSRPHYRWAGPDLVVKLGSFRKKWTLDRSNEPQVSGAPVAFDIPQQKWDIGTGIPLLTISIASTEYVRVPVTASSAGTFVNPTSDVVYMAFMSTSTATPGVSDWKAASWDTVITPPFVYVVQCLVGPVGTVTLGVGTYYVWVQIVDNPEIVIRPVGVLVVV